MFRAFLATLQAGCVNVPVLILVLHLFFVFPLHMLAVAPRTARVLKQRAFCRGKRMEDLEKEKRAVTKSIDADAAAKKKEAEEGGKSPVLECRCSSLLVERCMCLFYFFVDAFFVVRAPFERARCWAVFVQLMVLCVFMVSSEVRTLDPERRESIVCVLS